MALIKHLVDLDLSKNQILNAVVQNLAVAPSSPSEGQIYWSTADNTLYVWNEDGSTWVDLGSSGITNLSYTAGVSNGVVTSDTGTDATIPLADATNAGLFSAAEKSKLAGVEANAKDDQTASEVSSSASGNLSSTNVQDALVELQGDIDSLNSTSSNDLSITHNGGDVDIAITNGTDITLDGATSTLAGAMSASDKSKLDGIEAGAKDDQIASEVPSTASGNLSSTNVQDALVELQGDIDSLGAETNNLSITHNVGDVDIAIENGTDIVLNGATTLAAGAMSKADKIKLDAIEAGAQANVADVLTSIGLAANQITYTDELGNDTVLDLSTYLDDTNLARLTSGSIDGSTGLATFTRDDASTFTIDMSAFLDAITLNNTLTSTSTTEGLTAAQGKVLKDLIDAIDVSGTNTGDELPASTTVAGVIELATQTEVNAGTDTTRAITPSRLRSTLGITASLSTTLTYSQLVGGATSQVITHSIGNQFVQVSVYEVASMDKVECEVELTSANTVTLKFNVAPTASSLRVVIVG